MSTTKIIKALLFCLGIAAISTYQIHANSSGASSPKTGAPNENTCTSCHGGSVVTSGTQHARIRMNVDLTGNGYIPDSTYKITVTYAETGKSRFGFQLTALNASNQAAGTFSSSTRTATFSSSVNGSTRYYIEHNSTGSSSISTDSTAWTFDWKAPSSNVGDITFYLALNSANNNGSTSGDVIYNKTFKISASTLLPVASGKVNSTTLCQNSSIELEASSTNNPTSYAWTFPGGVPSSSAQQKPKVTYNTAGAKIALLRSFNNKGASKIDTVKFTVLDAAVKPNLNIRTPNTLLCLGDTIEFSYGATLKHTYKWRNGATGRTLLVDSGGWVGVTATRDNGCFVKSDSVFVVAVPKPKFNVNYGITNDTVCVNESLITIINNKGFADSFSLSGKAGTFFADSFLLTKLNAGANTFKYWAKSKIGCVNGPSTERIFHGIDTPNAPNLRVAQRLNDRILFSWDSIQWAQSYEYSINQGKTWITSNLDSNRSQWIIIDSATQNVAFWIRAKTGIYCGYSRIGKISAKGASCTEPTWTIIKNRNQTCRDSLLKLTISGLSQLNKRYNIYFNGQQQFDTIISFKGLTSKSYTFELFDSLQPLCGNFEKIISVTVDSVPQTKFDELPKTQSIFCAIEDSLSIPYKILNYNNNFQYGLSLNNDKPLLISENNFINIKHGIQQLIFFGQSENGCPLKNDTFEYYVDTLVSTDFMSNWINDRVYSIKAFVNDTINYRHIWFDSATGTRLTLKNVAEFEFDFAGTESGNSSILHQMQSIHNYQSEFDTLCMYQSVQNITTNNLKTDILIAKSPYKFDPNPTFKQNALTCINCSNNTKVKIFGSTGKIYFQGDYKKLREIRLETGIYLIQWQEYPKEIQKIVVID